MGDADDARLDRIEQKLDKMAEALVSLVRIEERTSTLFKRLDATDERMNSLSKRVADLEKTSDTRGVTFALVDRVFWIAITAAVGMGAYWVRGG
ncbi:hypothetical protein [Oricola sp.]|uniref:hypothetical protein n=1 Tax=Oricola sp. TaxID=1979950 RepID=UPI0025CC1B77|nr:hypothetical protein [Oricola sp.]MCI5078687.1 hypothetical protein [Oricola sp.]